MDRKILIVGYGVVGHNLAEELRALEPWVYDKYKDIEEGEGRRVLYDFVYPSFEADIAFICVDTPRTPAAACDLSAVRDVLSTAKAKVFVLKSTVLPGTTEALRAEFPGKRIVFSPEYYGGTQHCNNFDFDFTILGGDKDDCAFVQQALQECYDARHRFVMTDSTTAELAKYMENAWLATKVSFCQQFSRLAAKCGVRYEELRELFILDPRVNPSHTFVYDDHPYWDSHCLNKDVPAIAEWGDADLLKAVIAFNESCKGE